MAIVAFEDQFDGDSDSHIARDSGGKNEGATLVRQKETRLMSTILRRRGHISLSKAMPDAFWPSPPPFQRKERFCSNSYSNLTLLLPLTCISPQTSQHSLIGGVIHSV
jgi:hypothetical protein